MRSKITIVGAGNVGAACAQQLAQRDYADIVLVDVIEGLPQGKALDLLQSGPISGTNSHLIGTASYEDTVSSDIAIITSGVSRRPGMSREELLLSNREIVQDVTHKVVKHSPDCIIIVVTNPVDAMAQLALHTSRFPRNRVLGMSGILDSARFRTFLALELGVSAEDIFACVLGGHGDTMVPIPRLTTVGGIPVTEILSPEAIAGIVERTIKGGAEIVSLLQVGSAYYAPAAAVAQMVDSIILGKKRILPSAVYLAGEYGIHGVFLSVPVKLGRNGVEQIMEIKLLPEEDRALKISAQAVRQLVQLMNLPQQ